VTVDGPPAHALSVIRDKYEALRSSALVVECNPAKPEGFAFLVRSGVVAWANAIETTSVNTDKAPKLSSRNIVADEIELIVADIILERLEEKYAWARQPSQGHSVPLAARGLPLHSTINAEAGV